VVPSYPTYPPSKPCGSPRKNMMNPAHPSSTVSVSKVIDAISYQFYTL